METSTLAVQDFTSFVFADGENLKTTSLIVAKKFGKTHAHVLRDIEVILTQVSDIFGESNFGLSEYEYKNNLGHMIKAPFYNLTKDGLVMLVMGYTGKTAMAIKETYINAFNFMRDKLFGNKLKYGLKQMPLPCFETPIIISRHTTMMTNEMITQFKHAIDVFARESNLTKNRISRRLADAFDADNWKLIPIENYPHVCAKLGVNPIFEVESTNDIAIVESKKVAQLERDNQLLRMELYRIKEGSVGDSPVNSQAMKESILKIADALDELAFYA